MARLKRFYVFLGGELPSPDEPYLSPTASPGMETKEYVEDASRSFHRVEPPTREILEHWVRCPTLEQRRAQRARIVLAAARRSGAPPIYTPEQIIGILAIACEPPEASGRPVSHWTARELAEEAVQRKIVPSISTRTVGREAAPDPLLAASGAGGSGAV